MSAAGLEKTGAVVAMLVISQAWARWRVARQARRDLAWPAFDLAALEAALAPRREDGDDPPTLESLRTLCREYRQPGQAESLPAEISHLYSAANATQQATICRALTRLRRCGDAVLEALAAQTGGAICESKPPLSPDNER
jgi:hypothetical protein